MTVVTVNPPAQKSVFGTGGSDVASNASDRRLRGLARWHRFQKGRTHSQQSHTVTLAAIMETQ